MVDEVFIEMRIGVLRPISLYMEWSRVKRAEAISQFMIKARKQSKQENIPMNLEIYSVPRSAGSSKLGQFKIFDRDL